MNETMKAAIQADPEPVVADIERPRPAPTEVLVKVRAASLNRADLNLAAGRPHGGAGGRGSVLGLEWSGDVMEVGVEVPAWVRVGDRLMCSGIGGFAECAVCDWRRALPFPGDAIGYEAGAGLPISLRTAHDAIATKGQLRPGQSVLILGAASGVGLMSLQIAQLLGAGLVVGTSTQGERRTRLAAFGCDLALDTTDPAWSAQLLERTGGRGVDVVVDFLSGPLLNDTMRATALEGTIVNVGRLAGDSGVFDFDLHALRRIRYLGVTFRTRTLDEVDAIGRRVRDDLWPALQAGRLGVPIEHRFPLERVAEAFALMRSNAHFGKIVLTMD